MTYRSQTMYRWSIQSPGLRWETIHGRMNYKSLDLLERAFDYERLQLLAWKLAKLIQYEKIIATG